jgi:hypothetical protein
MTTFINNIHFDTNINSTERDGLDQGCVRLNVEQTLK